MLYPVELRGQTWTNGRNCRSSLITHRGHALLYLMQLGQTHEGLSGVLCLGWFRRGHTTDERRACAQPKINAVKRTSSNGSPSRARVGEGLCTGGPVLSQCIG